MRKQLYKFRVSIGYNDSQGKETPAMKAVMAGEEEAVKNLVFHHKCDINIPNSVI